MPDRHTLILSALRAIADCITEQVTKLGQQTVEVEAREAQQEEVEKLTDTQYQIIQEIMTAFATLGQGSGLMAILGSWGDTLPETEILEMMRDWNKMMREEGQITKN